MQRQAVIGALVAVLLLAAALRLYRLDEQSFWNDEGNSARLSERTARLIVEGTASDIHPPLYYLLLRAWREPLGASEFALRAFSAFVGLMLVAATYRLGRELAGLRVALPGAFLVAASPPLVYYSQEARMYSLLAFLAVLSTWLLLRWLRRDMSSKAVVGGYVLSAAAGLYTHYFFPAVLVAQNIGFAYWLWRRQGASKSVSRRFRAQIAAWLAVMVGVAILYLPWLPIFVRQAGGRAAVRPALPEFLPASLRWLSLGPTISASEARWPLLAMALLLIAGWLPWRASRPGRAELSLATVTFLCVATPVALMWIAGTANEPFYKFMLVGSPFLGLAAAGGMARIWSGLPFGATNWAGRALLIVLAVVFLLGSGWSLRNLYFDPAFARADYRAMAALIAAEDHPNAGIVLNAANQWEVFTYYHQEGAPVYPLPRGFPDPAAIESELSQIAAQHDRIYALFWGDAERDPERLVERWLDANAFKARDQWVGDVRFVSYAVPPGERVSMETRADLPFGEDITLVGHSIGDQAIRPGGIIPITLFWRTGAPLSTRYKVFLHLVRNGEIVAQRDSEPGGGLNLTTIWQVGEVVTDNHGLSVPVTTKPGTYELLLGMYNLSDPTARLPIQTEEGTVDAYRLAVIEVR